MQIIREPKIYLVGKSEIDQNVVNQFLSEEADTWTTDTENGTELLSELAGRVCYMSFGEKQGRKDNASYLGNIISSKHGSVLEHVVWNFIISGVSRSFSHELVRHRAGFAYSQLSQRYVDESDTDFVMPPLIQEAENYEIKTIGEDVDWEEDLDFDYSGFKLGDLWKDSVRVALEDYKSISHILQSYIEEKYPDLPKRDKRKKAREAARSVLPNATETKVFMSANARALRHFIEYRGYDGAEAEIRRVALELAKIMQTEAPNIFGDYEITDHVHTENEKI